MTSSSKRLGDFELSLSKFSKINFNSFKDPAFAKLHVQEQQNRVSEALYQLIEQEKAPCFLLSAVVDFIERVGALVPGYTFSHFELWLNQFSGISSEDNYRIRAKVAGKLVPRAAYQSLFPIGMGKVYPGSHFVTAHKSPDLDTTIASFWGWLDAFAARVSEGLHVWNLPGGAPESQVEISLLFSDMLGRGVFLALSRTRTALSISAMELMTQKGLVKETADASILRLDHDGAKKAIVLVDSEGRYIGDWKSIDVETVRQVISAFNHCLRWFSQYVQEQLLSFFALEDLREEWLEKFVTRIFSLRFSEFDPWNEFTHKQRLSLERYLQRIFGVAAGSEVSFEAFIEAVHQRKIGSFRLFVDLVKKGPEQKTESFEYVLQVMKALSSGFEQVRRFAERLDEAIRVKQEVFDERPVTVSARADIDEVRAKISNHAYVSVSSASPDGTKVPLGVIYGSQISATHLGTVTLRDFCNTEETKVPSYLEVISVIDHHKSKLHTQAAPLAVISDAQSANVLCAELAFHINDRFSTRGMSPDTMQAQIDKLSKEKESLSTKKSLARLLSFQVVAAESGDYFIDPKREMFEYLQFLYGIFDDTDLLTKVSDRDVECVVQLVNRMKSIAEGQEVEILSLADIPRDGQFAKAAAERILQHPDVYSLYQKVYASKEKRTSEVIVKEAQGEKTEFFADTKEQNGCARVGQAKLFPSNYSRFKEHAAALQKNFLVNCENVFAHSEIDLHMQMISTIAGAEEVFSGKKNQRSHGDELWLWIPFTETSIEHLKEFLMHFSRVPKVAESKFVAEFYGKRAEGYAQIFAESFSSLSSTSSHPDHSHSFVRLIYPAGLLNSRKAMISPYLPKLIT